MDESRELDGIHFLFPVGEKTPEKGRKSFTGGDVYHFMFIPHESKLNCPLGNVTYTPGSRNSWHAHPGLQVLLITYGRGWYQEEGRSRANSLRATMSSWSRASNIGMAPQRTAIWRSWGLLPTAPKIPR